jgi:hypothetical protein
VGVHSVRISNPGKHLLPIFPESLEGYSYQGQAEGWSVGNVAEDLDGEAERRIADVARVHGSRLDLARLGLTAVPDSIGQLTALTNLDLSYNQLTAVPDSIGQLTCRRSCNSPALRG